jgi:inner membrane protein
MKGVTHIATGAVSGILLAELLSVTAMEALPITAATIVGGLLPDIDICTSKLGKVIAPASFVIQHTIGHRTIFHGLFLYLAAFVTLTLSIPGGWEWWLAGLIGVVTHLLLDILNPAGVPLFWPWPRRFSLRLCKSGGLIDWLLAGILSILAASLAFSFH